MTGVALVLTIVSSLLATCIASYAFCSSSTFITQNHTKSGKAIFIDEN